MIDAHCHLDKINDMPIEEVIKKCEEEGIRVITSCASIEEKEFALKLAEKYKIVFVTLGLHPTRAEKMDEKELEDYIEFIKRNREKIVGIGETGMDKFVEDERKEKEVFEKFIELAIKLNLPLVIHCRGKMEEAIEILESYNPKSVLFHCYSGNATQLKRILENGWFVSIATNIENIKNTKKAAKKVPLDKFTLETDSPWLDPFSKELKNKPWNIKYTAQKIAEMRNLEKDYILEMAKRNAERLFRL